ncbi:hypothetical protein CBM2599_A120500 [Cupriavidus taiwanensis]|uniref:hypothetical protein n=1 Tax=Cupriavidus taiwanensis TaxID=164546 RepID=UPI000E146BB8|nr:hypothetical protein [Cupriavidus taiwanensis]SOY79935.1 hypothetical protein CBM2599_A120500 [Cupriavidus taiwanensis]SOY81904.1 hypothetical protein CBM2600_A120522 [Cupriavidus taiwanensis]
MKATITESGVLLVTPETPLETFALGKWSQVAFAGQHEVVTENTGETFTLLRGAHLIVGGNVPAA